MSRDFRLPPKVRAIVKAKREQEERERGSKQHTFKSLEEREQFLERLRIEAEARKPPPCKFYVMVIPRSERARMHRGDCRVCKDGHGKAGAIPEGNAPYWSAAFDEVAGASAFMAALNFSDIDTCLHCRPR